MASATDDQKSNRSSDGESSGDEPLFTFQSRGAFKRKRNPGDDDDEEEDEEEEEEEDNRDERDRKGKDDGNSSSSDEDDEGAAFDSSPDMSGRGDGAFSSLGLNRSRAGAVILDLSSDDDGDGGKTCQPEKKVMDDAAMQEIARREADALVASASDCWGSAHDKSYEANRQFNRKAREDLEAASRIDSPDMVPRSMFSSAPFASPSAPRALTAGERERRAKRLLKLRVSRGRRVHIFNTRLGREVKAILEACRKELLDDKELGAELSLWREGELVDSTKVLMDAGITRDTDLVLEVKGAEAVFSGSPVTLKVRVEDAKVFRVKATMDMDFSTLMEAFCDAVGVPEDRRGEAVMTFDGDRLNLDDTPQGVDMDDEDLIDAKLPADLLSEVQRSPSEILLTAKPRRKKSAAPVSSDAGQQTKQGQGIWGASEEERREKEVASMAHAAGDAAPLGRSTRHGRTEGSRTSKESEVIVLD